MKQSLNMPSKYEKLVIGVLTKQYVSTNAVRNELEKHTRKTISWFLIDKALRNLHAKGSVERIEANRITLWRLR